MNGWVSIIAMLAWLVLAFGAFRAHRVGARTALVMALAWAALFLLVVGVISMMGA